jgi:RNA polymerase sigma factor (TIGR02999 family)
MSTGQTRAQVSPTPVTALAAAEQLLPQVYAELRQLARARLAKLPKGQTLQATSLVHEVYLRLVRPDDPGWQNTAHFFFAAARAMHDVIIEHARQKASIKRGGGRERLNLEGLTIAHEAPATEIIALSEVLKLLESRDPRKHQVVMLRFFAGCSTDETATAMNLSVRTVERDWRYARAWLHQQLSDRDISQRGDDGGRT